MSLGELETQNEELRRVKEAFSTKFEENENCAKIVLKNALAKINKVEEEKNELKAELEEQDLRRKALASQLHSMRQDKENLEVEKDKAKRLMKKVEMQQLNAAQSVVSKNVAVKEVVQPTVSNWLEEAQGLVKADQIRMRELEAQNEKLKELYKNSEEKERRTTNLLKIGRYLSVKQSCV